IALMLYALPRLKADLDRLRKKSVGRPPDTQREICAAVVVEAWKLTRGKAEPHSLHLRKACSDYWLACGGKHVGEDDPDNCRRPIERALAVDHSWISQILLAVQNSDLSALSAVQNSQ